jgi:transposase
MLKRKMSQSDVARELSVSRQTVHLWAKQLAEANGAVGKLKAKTLGRPKRLNVEQRNSLSRMLVGGALQAGFPTELWTIKRVRMLVAREFGVEYSTSGGWELLRSLGFSPQKPEKRATQRDEQGIVQWKRKTWPALKKKPSGSNEPSSS